jgi:transposase
MESGITPEVAQYIRLLQRVRDAEKARADAERARADEERGRAERAERERDAALRRVRDLEARLGEAQAERRMLVAERDSARAQRRRVEEQLSQTMTRLGVLDQELQAALGRLARGEASRAGVLLSDDASPDEVAPGATGGPGTGRPKETVVVPPNTPTEEPKARKVRAPEHNHGRQRATATRTVAHEPQGCGTCGGRLGKLCAYRTREVIDLPPPVRVEAVKHEYFKGYCGACHRWTRAQPDLGDTVLGQARFGLRLTTEVAYLRTVLRMPLGLIQTYLEAHYEVRVSEGGLVGLLHQVSRRLVGLMETLHEEARASPVRHMDETFWRENGQNGYVWTLATETGVRLFTFARSRAAAIANAMLGPRPHGTLVTDFYSAYNDDTYAHQRCWSHMKTASDDLKRAHQQDASVTAWLDDLWALYDKAIEHTGAGQAAYDAIVAESNALAARYATAADHPCRTLANRLLRFQDQLYRFVLDASIPATNNLAERAIRPVTVLRKISGGTRSPEGTTTRMRLASAFSTWLARQLDPLAECRQTLVNAQTPARG